MLAVDVLNLPVANATLQLPVAQTAIPHTTFNINNKVSNVVIIMTIQISSIVIEARLS